MGQGAQLGALACGRHGHVFCTFVGPKLCLQLIQLAAQLTMPTPRRHTHHVMYGEAYFPVASFTRKSISLLFMYTHDQDFLMEPYGSNDMGGHGGGGLLHPWQACGHLGSNLWKPAWQPGSGMAGLVS